tara:strand:+ start:9573 stop:10289 length:717 start_codon:yes stop_codon:yes gene_type:complete
VLKRVALYKAAFFLFIKKHFMQIEVTIPSSLKEVSLKDYQKFLLIENPNKDDLLKCILNINTKELGKIKDKDVDYLTTHIDKLFNQDHKFIPTFTLDGTLYGFIPNLDEITYGENKDITSYINEWGNMHKAMAVLFRPIKQKQGSKYLIHEYEGSHKYSEVMKKMPLSVVLGAMVFFYNLTNALLKSMPNYLDSQLKTEQMQEVVSQENGEVIQNYILLLKATLQDLKKLQNFHYINV